MKLLSEIQVVMVNTTLPANIGSAARAMHTMGLSNLVVIDPKFAIDDSSYAHAAGGTHILDDAKVVSTLDEAIADSKLIFAASSRSRTMPRPVVNPRQAAQIMADFLSGAKVHSSDKVRSSSISILFGREDRGLTNEELAVADYHIQIDANPEYPVLNVASAVQVIASFIYSYFRQHTIPNDFADMDQVETMNLGHQLQHTIRQDWDSKPITYQQQQALSHRAIELMTSLQLADSDDLRLLPQRLSRLTSRLQLDEKEYQLLQSVIGKLLTK